MKEMRDCMDYPGYAVSNDGTILSFHRSPTGQIIKAATTRKGYKRARLNGRSVLVHRVVAMEWLTNSDPRNLTIVNHKDGNKLNNSVDNLEWCSPSHNLQHAYDLRLKIQNIGSKHGRAKLNEAHIQMIRAERSSGKTIVDIAKRYHVSKSLIGYICQNKIWTHV